MPGSAASLARRPASLRYGRETPRIFTPPLRRLTARTSLGPHVIKFADDVLGVHLFPWQRWLLLHMLELMPDNRLRFRTVVVLVARQNGKSTLGQVLALWFMYDYGAKMILGTAQDLDTAEEVWQGAVDLVTEEDEDGEPVRPELFSRFARENRSSGQKSLVLKTGERYKVKAANRRAGRGLPGNVILLDELREHQTWDAWGSVTGTTMAQELAFIVAFSNAGDAASVVLRSLRMRAHLALDDPDGINEAASVPVQPDDEDEDFDDDSLGIFEWSAPPKCKVWDRDAWEQANPSMGYIPPMERNITGAARDPDWVFRTEVLCQWSDGYLEGTFPPGSWDACGVGVESQIVGNVKACVDVSVDRTHAHIALAGRTSEGVPQVELVATNLPIDYVLPWLQDPKRVDLIEAVTAQLRGAPVSSLIPDWIAAGVPYVEWAGSDVTNGTGNFYDLVRTRGLLHTAPNAPLDIAAATAIPKMLEGGAFMWDRKRSPTDAAPLIAATGAIWLLSCKTPEPVTSAYESSGLMVV